MRMIYSTENEIVRISYEMRVSNTRRKVVHYEAKPTFLLLSPTNEKKILRVHFDNDYPEWLERACSSSYESPYKFVKNAKGCSITQSYIQDYSGYKKEHFSIMPTMIGHINYWFKDAKSDIALKFKEALLNNASRVEENLLSYSDYFAELKLFYSTAKNDKRFGALDFLHYPTNILNEECSSLESWELLIDSLINGPKVTSDDIKSSEQVAVVSTDEVADYEPSTQDVVKSTVENADFELSTQDDVEPTDEVADFELTIQDDVEPTDEVAYFELTIQDDALTNSNFTLFENEQEGNSNQSDLLDSFLLQTSREEAVYRKPTKKSETILQGVLF